MLIKDLKELIKYADDNLRVLIPVSNEFNGLFYSPCNEISGIGQAGIEDIEEDTLTQKNYYGRRCIFTSLMQFW